MIFRSLHTRRCETRARHYHALAAQRPGDAAERNSPADWTAVRQLETMLFRVLEQLPREQSEVFRLREFEGLSYPELAGRLDLPVGTVRSRLCRARCAVRKALIAQLEPKQCPVCHEPLDDSPAGSCTN